MIPVPETLPEHLLGDLTVTRRTTTYDPDDGSESHAVVAGTIQGRITRGGASEDTANGRQAGIQNRMLLTNNGDLLTDDEISDPVGSDGPGEPGTWQVIGLPVPIVGANRWIHHYEVPLRRVEG